MHAIPRLPCLCLHQQRPYQVHVKIRKMVLNSNIDYYTLRLTTMCGSVGMAQWVQVLAVRPWWCSGSLAHTCRVRCSAHICNPYTLLDIRWREENLQELTGWLWDTEYKQKQETLPTSTGEEKQLASPFPTTQRESIKETIIKKYRIIECGNFHGGKKKFN